MAAPPAIRAEALAVTLQDGDRRFRLVVPTLEIAPGAALALTGPSGTGKTLLLELLGLLRRPDADGRLLLRAGERQAEAADLWRQGAGALAAWRGAAMGFVPQTGGLLPFLTLAENIALTQAVAGRPDPDHARALADRLRIADLLALRPDRLSIGQRQRGAIAAALAHRPALVIADEPTAALDPEAAEDALRLILEAAADTGAAVILSSHDAALVARLGVPRVRLVPQSDAGGVTSVLDSVAEGVPA
jgi:putative ABC transport system ATP-binding protein